MIGGTTTRSHSLSVFSFIGCTSVELRIVIFCMMAHWKLKSRSDPTESVGLVPGCPPEPWHPPAEKNRASERSSGNYFWIAPMFHQFSYPILLNSRKEETPGPKFPWMFEAQLIGCLRRMASSCHIIQIFLFCFVRFKLTFCSMQKKK
jgi:hypothetical protein